MTTARPTAADKAADQERENAKAAEQTKASTAKETETVKVSDPNDNARVEEVPRGIAEPERPLAPTARDAAGVDRILPSTDRTWTPAPLDATDEDKKAAEKREKREEEIASARKEGRVDSVSGEIVSREDHKKAQKA